MDTEKRENGCSEKIIISPLQIGAKKSYGKLLGST
jgi:hypothetical protein